MHIVHLAPHFPTSQRRYAQALKRVGARVTGIGEAHANELPHDVASALDEWVQVRNVTDAEEVTNAVRWISSRNYVNQVVATIEAHMYTAAHVREALGIPGLSVQQTVLVRDKTVMKQFMRDNGIPTAQSASASSAQEVIEFGRRVGYPIILKPRDSAGADRTYRVDREQDLDEALYGTGVAYGRSVALEEFIEGHEGFYDTLTVHGKVRHDFISHYYPGVLEALRHRWISPLIICTNRHDAPGYSELKEMGKKVIQALDLDTSPTHMEWFFGPKGLKFSEIGARPPGVSHWDIYCAANDIDLYKEWADSLVWGNTWGQLSRQYAAAQVGLRPTQDGRIVRYEGIEKIQAKYGQWVFDAYFPPVGTPTQPIEAGYKANAWIHLKYPDYDDLLNICMEVANTIKVIAA